MATSLPSGRDCGDGREESATAAQPDATPAEIEYRVVTLRQQRPDWGARKLQVLLKGEGILLPVITLHRILLRHDLVRMPDRHRWAVQRFERGASNQLWQMDFKGLLGWQAPVGSLSVLDDHSRYAIALAGTWSTRAEPVRERLEEAFQHCGVPEEMLMDHGTPWWNKLYTFQPVQTEGYATYHRLSSLRYFGEKALGGGGWFTSNQ